MTRSNLGQTLDRVVENVTLQIEATRREQYLRSRAGSAVAMLAVVPILAVILQATRYWMGLPAGFGFSLVWAIVLSVAFPCVWLLARTLLHRVKVTRQRALGKMDRQLGASERLVTADQFLKEPAPDPFMQAAVEDAVEWAGRGRSESIPPDAYRWTASRISWAAIPIAALLLWLSVWISQQARPMIDDVDSPTALAMAENAITRDDSDRKPAFHEAVTEQRPVTVPAEQSQSDRRPDRRAGRKTTATVATPDDAQQSEGRLADGETSESQRSSHPSSARGEPSSSGQPSKSDTPSPRRTKKQQQPRDQKDRPEKERKQDEEPSGSTAGQGSSRGSNNNAAASDWSSKSQAATPDDEEIEQEDDVDDEDEEQKSRGGVQPNMRDRRTPVNRDLQIGFGNNRPNPDANGRGGPGGQKKSRGVASLVLGVPIPDRVTGQPNKGRIRITQQRITPEVEQGESVAAEDRGSRRLPVGRIAHPDLSPWLQNLVRRYFLDRRDAAPLQPGNSVPPSPQESTTTSRSAESDDSQS